MKTSKLWSSLSVIACLFLGARTCTGEILPAMGVVDGRIRVAAYDAAQVYRLHGQVGYQIDLQFEPGETFVGLGAGDIEGLAFVAQDNHLFLKPRVAKVETNLTVLTTRRHYQIDYSASSSRSGHDRQYVIFALQFTYPSAATIEEAEGRITAELTNASLTRPQNIDYWYCGHSDLKPEAVSDDGVHTRMRFRGNAELPAIFVKNDDGSESLLNFSMTVGDVIVHRVARRFVLRRGALTGCVVNKGFSGSGERLRTGTVAPGVQRAVPGVRP